MAVVSIDVEVNISEHLAKCKPGELAKALADYPLHVAQEAMTAAGLFDLSECDPSDLARALADYPRSQAQEALREEGLYGTEEDESERQKLEDLAEAFNQQDRTRFEILLARMFPNNQDAISFKLVQAPSACARAA